MRRKWSRHDPLMMRLVDMLVEKGMVLEAMYPINARVSKDQKERHAQNKVQPAVFVYTVISARVTAHLGKKPRDSQKIKPWEGTQRRLNLQLHLVFKEQRVLHEFLVEEKVIGHQGTREV